MRLGVARALVDGDIVEGDVEVDDGLISRVGLEPSSRTGTAVPGFIDLHTHGYGGVDFARDQTSALSEAAVALASVGVTAFQPTLMTLPEGDTIAALRRIADSAGGGGARILGAHLEGPFLSGDYPGAHDPGLLRDPDIELMERFLTAGPVTQVTLAPELPGVLDLIALLRSRGVVVSLGHSGASAPETVAAIEGGAAAITHLFNAMAPFHHRNPGIAGTALARDDIYIEVILDGVHLAREAETLAMRTAGDRLLASTDAMAGAGLGDGTYAFGNDVATVLNGEVHLKDGTIASSVLTLDHAFRRLVELGSDLASASRATSGSAAAMAGRPELGTLRPGTPADVVVLGDDLHVMATFVAGSPVFDL